MNNKRIGRPPNEAGHKYHMIGVSGTDEELAKVRELPTRQRMEAMLATIRDETPAQGKE